MVGTYLYFAIVFSLPICMGLAAIAMDLPVSALILAIPCLTIMHCCNAIVVCLTLWAPKGPPDRGTEGTWDSMT